MTASGLSGPRGAARAPRLRSIHPLSQAYRVEIDSDERRALQALAGDLRAREPALAALAAFGPEVETGLGPWPCLCIEDHSEISLFERSGDLLYSHRSLLLARDGDLAVMGVERNRAFEAYCRDRLGLGAPEILVPEGPPLGRPIALRCAEDEALLERAAFRARSSGGLNIQPYMGTGGVWRLAGAVARRGRVPVRVAAPPPRLARRVNDKLWFALRVEELLGRRALPPSQAAFGPAALAARVARFARSHAQVAVKLPASASAAGNVVLEAAQIEALSLTALRDALLARLRAAGWRGAFPLMVTAWEAPLLASPSVQLWIPDPGADPVLEGIFEQSLFGARHEFAGAAPTELAENWQERVAEEAMRLACLLQALGYFGRCSFDAILTGSGAAGGRLHWIECNGRWGGVSIPMTLANRLAGDWRRRPFVVAERGRLEFAPRGLAEVLEILGEELFVAGRDGGGAVILSPSRIEAGSGYEIMVLGETLAAARAQAGRVVSRLLGNGSEMRPGAPGATST